MLILHSSANSFAASAFSYLTISLTFGTKYVVTISGSQVVNIMILHIVIVQHIIDQSLEFSIFTVHKIYDPIMVQ